MKRVNGVNSENERMRRVEEGRKREERRKKEKKCEEKRGRRVKT